RFSRDWSSDVCSSDLYEGDPARHAGKLEGKKALITGGDSGIGRAVAVAFAREGADVAIAYLDEQSDAVETKAAVERLNKTCLLLDRKSVVEGKRVDVG